MNQYEKGKHEPNVQITRKIALVLNVPEAYFYASDDDLAKPLTIFHRLSKDKKSRALELVASISVSET